MNIPEAVCVPAAPSMRRCATHLHPLYPSGRCRIGLEDDDRLPRSVARDEELRKEGRHTGVTQTVVWLRMRAEGHRAVAGPDADALDDAASALEAKLENVVLSAPGDAPTSTTGATWAPDPRTIEWCAAKLDREWAAAAGILRFASPWHPAYVLERPENNGGDQ